MERSVWLYQQQGSINTFYWTTYFVDYPKSKHARSTVAFIPTNGITSEEPGNSSHKTRKHATASGIDLTCKTGQPKQTSPRFQKDAYV